jgi:DNA mismatch repair protein MutL
MSIINILSPHVADLIAAGEVVERPGAVVKELIENAIDAGASTITVEIKAGGVPLIRVRDNGCGMSPEDAGVAFLRHATSKLRDAEGLERIGTLGFRGEALAAISAVSRIEMQTRLRGQLTGTRITLDAGEIQELQETGCPEGTVITVRDLFYNTPARLKFLKSDRTEGAYCVAQALRCALGRPDVSIRCIRDGQEQFFSPGDGRIDSCLYSLLGRELVGSMLPCVMEDEKIRVEGYVSAPHSCRGNRGTQYFFVNGRSIKSPTMQAALEQAYKNTMMTGRFPACALYVTVSYGAVDVNVHPTKNEVKFSDERLVFNGVYYGVKSALEAETGGLNVQLPATPQMPEETPPALEPDVPPRRWMGEGKSTPVVSSASAVSTAENPAFERVRSDKVSYQTGQSRSGTSRGVFAGTRTQRDRWAYDDLFAPRQISAVKTEADAGPISDTPAPERQTAPPAQTDPIPTEQMESSTPAREVDEAPLPFAEVRQGPELRVIGETMDTYILAEFGEELLLIDKHAAHERMLFDRLASGAGRTMSQMLLAPIPFSPGPEDAERMLENRELLEELGFEIEAYGAGSIILRGAPAELQGEEISALEELCEKLRGVRAGLDLRDELLHTVACKAAIKAGSPSDPRELQVLAEKVAAGEIRYCPHGRPVAVRLTKKELDKQFKRIV